MKTFLSSALLALFIGLLVQGCEAYPPYPAKPAKPSKTTAVSAPSFQGSSSKTIVLGGSLTTNQMSTRVS